MYYIYEISIAYVLHMFCRCVSYMCNTSKYTTHVLRAYYTCNTHIAHFLMYVSEIKLSFIFYSLICT